MRAYDIIQKKRDGQTLSEAELAFLIDGLKDGSVADYQLSAFLMATYFRGMAPEEVVSFTRVMLHSGVVVDLGDVPGVKVDKHSTGGVGDKISLPLAPAVAACGVPVPMISGRGLGHTGGTLDKLESIPGFCVDLSLDDYRRLVRDVGCCLIGQTKEVAPADKKLYALRDVTATVDCIPLIAASILSKKLAEGIDALVLDVKVGSGAFMKTAAQARALAETMVGIGSGMGKKVVARLTAMEQPIGRFVGNALEVRESIEVLRGAGPTDTVALTVELGAEMLVLGGVASSLDEGRARITASLHDGSALAKFRQIVEAQHGDPRVLDEPGRLPTAPAQSVLTATRAGRVVRIDSEAVGVASLVLGGGRLKAEDAVDPRVGLELEVRLGDVVQAGQPLVRLHHADRGLDDARARLAAAIVIDEDVAAAVDVPALFQERIAS
jgi:pyrimidine-nucleoside phosphorylase